jgi:hypothetical protein
MNSHLILSLKPIYSTPFPLITYACGRLLYGAFWESLFLPRFYKWDVVKTRQDSHGLTETRPKGHWKIMLYQGGERAKYTHFEIGGHVQMSKSDTEAQRKSSLSDCTWLENEYESFNLEALKFLMHFREPGSLFYFTYSHSFLFSYTYIFFIYFFFFLSHQIFFICSPWTLKLHCTYLLPH